MRANINLKFRGIESTLYYDDIPDEGSIPMYYGNIHVSPKDKLGVIIPFSGKTIHEAVYAFEKAVNRWLNFGEAGEIKEHGKY